jgi:two-component system response regulator HydG
MQNCRKRSTLLTQGDLSKKMFYPQSFFNRQHVPSNESNLALSDNEKRDYCKCTCKDTTTTSQKQPNSLKLLEKRFYNKIKIYNIN